jgi:lysophospholipase L1-like esterase
MLSPVMRLDRRRFLAGSFVVAVTVTALGVATLGSGPAPLPPPAGPTTTAPPHRLLALGDSVAAGFGLADPDAQAYPALVAARTGRSLDVRARPGACVVVEVRGCATNNVFDQLRDVRSAPDVVTITVGANDIGFAYCLAGLFGVGSDTCSGASYADALASFGERLGALVRTVRARWPGAVVLVSRYYDPLPATAGDLCGLDRATFSGGGIGDRTTRRIAKRVFDARITEWEQSVFTRVSDGLARLNAVIDRVVPRAGGQVVSLDFTGHDLCAPEPWVYAPDVVGRVRFRWAGPDYDERLRYRAAVRCTAPCGPTVPFTTKVDARVGTLSFTGTVIPNGAPHPDAAGQRSIAAAFISALASR